MKPASSAAEPVAPVDRLCSLMAMVVLLWEIDSPFPPSAIEADIDHGHAAAGAVLWELLWYRYEGFEIGCMSVTWPNNRGAPPIERLIRASDASHDRLY
jgi:hypothetical protein